MRQPIEGESTFEGLCNQITILEKVDDSKDKVVAAKPVATKTSRSPLATITNEQANTGKWTTTEHSLFLKGLDEHGKDYKKIAALLKTRTANQARNHAFSEDQSEERRRLKKKNMKQGSHVKAQRKRVTKKSNNEVQCNFMETIGIFAAKKILDPNNSYEWE